MPAELFAAPHRHARERPAVRQREAAHLEDSPDAEHARAHAAGAATNPNSSTLRLDAMPASASCASIVPSRPRVWRSGSAATNQPTPRREPTSPSSREHVERLADRDPAGVVRCAEIGLAR